ncbi:nucleolar rRNA processing protein, putative [Plasmodium relictum]|uniref:Nucleolar rRNA processing protein, putative n=1 Tax=Plasmodium relictum TaxID=85471 RepID=A0A1J1HD24_PLARL|nr:nucleolar rRNA processing protein, putative [Plasmodium relictum]CRH02982.1 nucleolar rRNA processing protein, putative [Plasmodium relictum]
MSDLFVEHNINTEKIEEEKVDFDENKIIYKIKRKIKKKGIKRINYLPIKDEKLHQILPNTKNIKNIKLKNKLKKDVKLAIISSKKILANSKFKPAEEGYIEFDSNEERNVTKKKKKKNTNKKKEVSKNEINVSESKKDSEKQIKKEGTEINNQDKDDEKKLSKGKLNIYETEKDELYNNTVNFIENNENYINEKKKEVRKYLSQNYIYNNADIGTQKKVFDLNLSLGPYSCNYSRNGKYLLATGEKGHISLIDTQNLESLCEFEVDETIRCNTILHNHKLFAVGQKKYIYIYDNTGLEINCIKDILYTYKMEFLPYHFLLVSIGEFGELVYQDISVGNIVTRKKTKKGSCSIMKQNKNDAIIYLGHKNGHVTLWSPNVDKSVCDIFCHYTPISSIGVSDNYLITASVDCTYKLWDMRKLQFIKSYRAHNIINNIEISDTSIVGFSMNSHFRTYKNFFTSPEIYLTHNMFGDKINSLSFQPFEDICCAGLKYSIKTLLVPGAGIANIDTFVNNPYETKKQVRENEIRLLLDKLPPDTIKFQKNEIGKLNPYIKQCNGENNEISNHRNNSKNGAINKNTKMKSINEANDSCNNQSENYDSTSDDFTIKENKNKNNNNNKNDTKKKKKKKKKNSFLNSKVPKYLRKSLKDKIKEKEKS